MHASSITHLGVLYLALMRVGSHVHASSITHLGVLYLA
jgi:hypothetical protein